ncbi:YybS family protein [Phosphitispora sp. TUW77]|uniref:YybS family protein n=1 Tax=Phosphitispora sp. TUW77 TaxID=3152361 RepID=UPI003AB2BCA5
MTEQQKLGSLVEGSLMALITAVVGTLAIWFLPVKFLVDFIWGIPIIIITKKYNLRTGLLTLGATFFITALISGPVMTLLLLIELAPLAAAYAILFKYKKSPWTILVVGVVVAVISDLITVLGYFYFLDMLIVPTEKELGMLVEQFVSLYTGLGIDINQVRDKVEAAIRLAIMLIPSTMAIVAAIRAFITYIVAVRVLRRLNYKIEGLPSFSRWQIPWYSVWVLISGLVMSLAGDYYKLGTLAAIGKNMVCISAPLFFIIGVSVVTYFFQKLKGPKWVRVLFVILAIINFNGSLVLFTLVGLFDPLVSFRNWWREPMDE